MPPLLTDPVALAGRTAPSRVVFGAHETNLGRGRALSDRHTAYYRRRAEGGAGVIVTETASVAPDDHPYAYAPLASACAPGWRRIAAACRPHGALVLAGLGHAGAQGSSAHSQHVLWAPSPVADVVSREMPAAMEKEQIDAVVAGFAAAAAAACEAGADGVEVDAGGYSLLRQFQSGLSNLREDAYGADRLLLTRRVLDAVRAAIGGDRVLALRMSCDELAPWAGTTPEQAAGQVRLLAPRADLLTVVRAGPMAPRALRPDAHTPPGFNLELCAAMRRAARGRALVSLQGSVVDPAQAQAALDAGAADLVEMVRAQIADARLVALVRAGEPGRIRPCVLCNQACQVRDDRNPPVSCVGDPRSGHEREDPDPEPDGSRPPAPAGRAVPGGGAGGPLGEVLVVGGGPAGLECARVLAGRGLRVRLVERTRRLGGMLRTAAALDPEEALRAGAPPGAPVAGRTRLGLLADWLESECQRLGVRLETGTEATAADLDAVLDGGGRAVLATGSRAAPLGADTGGVPVFDIAEAVARPGLLPAGGALLVHDPVGGPVGVAAAELFAARGREVRLATPDTVAGRLLAPTGDLADANGRLQRAGVVRELRCRLESAGGGRAVLRDVWTAARREVGCAAVVDCGPRLPEDALHLHRPDLPRCGDAVAPRTVLEAVLEGRRTALALAGAAGPATLPPPGAAAPIGTPETAGAAEGAPR
ncbi:mycofactocin system FadH/OYE family oxidoreductase 1 [Nocardiopsis sp. CNT-189]|uniref:mycofactocin system FadH/OYE family oxidoreductase 1 n=1 Tax=Nocardiopsis oceanisediminis TaxID=2816862 RepID=UPI003B31E25F